MNRPAAGMRDVVGLMSGTSLDGIDAAFLRTDGERIEATGPARTLPFPASLRTRLRRLLDEAPRLAPGDPDIAAIGRTLAELYAEAVRSLAVSFDLVGMHGQTILHRPAERRTWQIGDAQHLADLLGCEVVHDFRANDVAAGGQGAPLVPLFHAALVPPDEPRPVAVLNIGGVANLTWIGPDAALLASDTGPGNALLDDFVLARTGRALDEGGRLALSGRPDHTILRALLDHPFFRRPPPKSLDRQDFADALRRIDHLSDADGAATLAAFTAAAVAELALPAAPDRVLVCGGGRHNHAIMQALREALGTPVDPVEVVGWNGDALEAQAFAHLAARSLRGLPLSLPATTGVPRPCQGGRLARPANARV